MRDHVYNRQLEETAIEIKNEAAAARFASLQKMLGNLPPTPAELDRIRIKGPWPGFGYPQKSSSKRYNFTVPSAVTEGLQGPKRTGGQG